VERNHNINIVNKLFTNVAKVKYFGETVTDQNYIYEELKSNLNLFQNTSHVLLRNLKIKIHKTIMLYIVSYAYETLKMNVMCSFEMLVDFYHTTQHYIPEGRTLPVGYGQNWKASGF
jgi:hypothetical protein